MEESEFVINFSALEKELQSAVEADRKYSRENDAKFRALRQNVASYEEFRDIVLASHLKPLERKDRAGAPRKQPWNAVASSEKCRDPQTLEGIQAQPSDFHPRTASEFSRDWRRLGTAVTEKYQLLLGLGGEALRGIFSAEVGFGLLGELLLVLSRGFKPVDCPEVVGVLDGLSRTPRFVLNVSLLSKEEMRACTELFQKIHKRMHVEPQCDASQCVEKASPSDTGTGSDGGGGVAVSVEAHEEDESLYEKVKYLMQIYGVSSSGT